MTLCFISVSEETINAAFGGILSKAELAPPNYKTPPYLTATPDVTSHKLTPRDKFLGKGSINSRDLKSRRDQILNSQKEVGLQMVLIWNGI